MVLKYQDEYHNEDDDLDLRWYLAKSIKAGNVEMVKFLATEIRRPRKYCSAHLDLPKYIKLAEIFPVNKDILEYLNSLTWPEQSDDYENYSEGVENSDWEN